MVILLYLITKIVHLISIVAALFLNWYLNCKFAQDIIDRAASLCEGRLPPIYQLIFLVIAIMIEKTLISIVYASYKEIQHMNFFPISKETMEKIKPC